MQKQSKFAIRRSDGMVDVADSKSYWADTRPYREHNLLLAHHRDVAKWQTRQTQNLFQATE